MDVCMDIWMDKLPDSETDRQTETDKHMNGWIEILLSSKISHRATFCMHSVPIYIVLCDVQCTYI